MRIDASRLIEGRLHSAVPEAFELDWHSLAVNQMPNFRLTQTTKRRVNTGARLFGSKSVTLGRPSETRNCALSV